MDVISSKDNEIVKEIRKLKDKKYRDVKNEYIIEGVKLVKEAILEQVNLNLIVVCEECIKDGTIAQKLLYDIAKYNCIYVTEKVFNTLTDVINHQGILGIVQKSNNENAINGSEDIIIVLDDIQDPGNLGTILRTLDSANLKQIILSKNTVDCYNPKVVRSTMGAIFRINIIESENLINTLKNLQKQKYEIAVTTLGDSISIYDMKYNKKIIVIGNEANGVSKEIQDIADYKIKIPMLGKTESLNASVATSIVVYEYVRQKISK